MEDVDDGQAVPPFGTEDEAVPPFDTDEKEAVPEFCTEVPGGRGGRRGAIVDVSVCWTGPGGTSSNHLTGGPSLSVCIGECVCASDVSACIAIAIRRYVVMRMR